MQQEFKMDSRLAQDIIQAQKIKNPEFDIPWDDFMTLIRASLGMGGFSVLDPSLENELIAKIKELETERDKKDEEYKNILETITKEIEAIKSADK